MINVFFASASITKGLLFLAYSKMEETVRLHTIVQDRVQFVPSYQGQSG